MSRIVTLGLGGKGSLVLGYYTEPVVVPPVEEQGSAVTSLLTLSVSTNPSLFVDSSRSALTTKHDITPELLEATASPSVKLIVLITGVA